MQSYQTLAERPRQSLTLVARPRRRRSPINRAGAKFEGNPLDFRLDTPYMFALFRLVACLRLAFPAMMG
jgi:hypothetical protein